MYKLIAVTVLVTMITQSASAETIQVSVNGLVCSFCATGLEKTFNKQASVESVKVDLERKSVTIHTRKDQTLDDTTVTSLIQDAGYTVTGIEREK